MESEQPLVVIAGPTASGKSKLALMVADHFKGEIICADSRTIYKGMDIGTAKPTKQNQLDIPHHLLDIVEPGEFFSVYDFQKAAQKVIVDIRMRGKIPILVGGTGLYIDSIIFNYQFPKKSDYAEDKFKEHTIEELKLYCNNNNIILPTNHLNRRHLIGAIERKNNKPVRRIRPLSNCIIVGITTDKIELDKRIESRTEYIFSHGVVKEAKELGKIYGWENESMTANIYPIIYQLDKRELTLEEAMAKNIVLDRQLAKRQLTWMKRNPYIKWQSLEGAKKYLFDLLAKLQ